MLSRECANYFINLVNRFPHDMYRPDGILIDMKIGQFGYLVSYYVNYTYSDDFGKTSGCIHLPNSDKGQLIFLRNSEQAKLMQGIEPYYTKHSLNEFTSYDLNEDGTLLLLNPYSNFDEYLYMQEPRANLEYVQCTVSVRQEYGQDFVVSILRAFGINHVIPLVRDYLSDIEESYLIY